MKNFTFAIIVVIFLSSNCFANHAEITFVTEHLPPYQIINEDSSVEGFATEVVLAVAQRTNMSYHLYGFSWVRTYNLALKKSNHCIFSMARIPSRENLFTWIGPITERNNAVVWSLKSNEHGKEVKTLNDLKHYITAVNESDVTHTAMLNIGLTKNKNLYVLEHSDSLINILVARPEIDFIVADDITIPHRAKLAGVSMDLLHRVIEVKSLSLNFYLACNKNTDDIIIEKLTTNLANIHQDGTYQKILERWKSKMPHIK
jgi:polar amino acid transport system substrate-binding protein